MLHDTLSEFLKSGGGGGYVPLVPMSTPPSISSFISTKFYSTINIL